MTWIWADDIAKRFTLQQAIALITVSQILEQLSATAAHSFLPKPGEQVLFLMLPVLSLAVFLFVSRFDKPQSKGKRQDGGGSERVCS
jgi:hypothetical protein